VQEGVPVCAEMLKATLAELVLHRAQLLLLFLYLLGQVSVLVLQEVQLGDQLGHLDSVLLARVP
jgi:hypothetical protein